MADTQSSAQAALFASSTSGVRLTDASKFDPATGQPLAPPMYLVDPLTGTGVLPSGFIASRVIAGQSFTASTGQLTAGGSLTGGFGFFNGAGTGKTLYLYELHFVIGNNSFNQIRTVTVDPAFGTSVTPVNNRIGSATASIATITYANANQTPGGTVLDVVGGASNTVLQALQNGKILVLPPGTGLALYTNLSGANNWGVTASWYEV